MRMTYRVCYEDGWAPTVSPHGHQIAERSEYFLNEHEALRRADEILRAGVHHRVSLIDGADKVLSGTFHELRLRTTAVE
jgi:hypothetical protein